MKNIIKITLSFGLICIIGCNPVIDKERTWSIYKADKESSSYSPLVEINRKNVKDLRPVWTFKPGDAVDGANSSMSESNPIVIDGIMYFVSGRHRLYALEARTGDSIWSFDPFNGGAGGGVSRGVTYWEDINNKDDRRILFTGGDELFALDALTGKVIDSFGDKGKISMNVGLRGDPSKISVKPTSPGIVYKNLIIMGAEVSELYGAEPGYIRAYDIKTGNLEWTFHTIPKPGEKGYETWPKDAWKYAGGVNNWAGMSLDEDRGMVFLALGSPAYDFYGANREGKNLFGNSVVALNASNGEYIWHYQTVHHDLWDYDLPAPPNLVTIEKGGKKIDAVAQTSKLGFLYLFNRDTGAPLFPIEEREVPPSNMPGEHAWPTQPFPLKPDPYARQYVSKDDLSYYSQASYDSLLKEFSSFRYEGLFTPPDTIKTLVFPGSRGGSNWGGGAFDPTTGVIYVKSSDSPEISHLKEMRVREGSLESSSLYDQGKKFYQSFCISCHGADRNGQEPNYPSLKRLPLKKDSVSIARVLNKIKDGSGEMPSFASVLPGEEEAITAYLFELKNEKIKKETASDRENIFVNEVRANEGPDDKLDTFKRYLNVTAYGHFRDSKGRPSIKPPWGTLNAINLNTGDFEWKIPVGNYPELQDGNAPTGTGGSAGPIVTAGGIVFLTGTQDKKIFAFDKDDGELLWESELPSSGTATPSTYMVGKKQYMTVVAAGNREEPGGYIITFSLP